MDHGPVRRGPIIGAMSPGLLVLLLAASLLALIPVWRLRVAGWPPRWLLTAWILYALGILVAVRFVGVGRFMLPILVLAYLVPFVAGPERLSRVLRVRRTVRPVIDVTPASVPGLPDPEPGARREPNVTPRPVADEDPGNEGASGTNEGASGTNETRSQR
jgi:hypothetical protein